ncbi:MAG: S41 family peptidase, partial [Flavobacteriaceae bacterium]
MKRNTLFLSLIVLLSVAIGYLFGSRYNGSPNKSTLKHPSINKLNLLMSYLTQDYVDKINADSLVRVVIEDIVSELDPHSIYIPAVESKSLSESMQGNFEGIGVQFRMLQDSIAVSRVLKGGPSEKAGLKSGDRILMADQDTLYSKALENEQIISRLKGNSSTPVRLTVYRKKQDSIYTFDLIRGPVPLPSVNASYMIDQNTGYIKINRFSQTTYSEFRAALTELLDQDIKDLIIDLRGNPGGYLLPAKQIADDFLEDQKPIVIVEGNNGRREKTVSSSQGLFEKGGL